MQTDDALARDGGPARAEAAVGLAVGDDRQDGQGHAEPEQHGVALRLQRVAQHHPFDQRNADGDRERDRQAGHLDRGDQQKVRDVEDEPADQRQHDVARVGAAHVVEKLSGPPLEPSVKARTRETRTMPIA